MKEEKIVNNLISFLANLNNQPLIPDVLFLQIDPVTGEKYLTK